MTQQADLRHEQGWVSSRQAGRFPEAPGRAHRSGFSEPACNLPLSLYCHT